MGLTFDLCVCVCACLGHPSRKCKDKHCYFKCFSRKHLSVFNM